MYIDADTIIRLASLLTALGMIVGAVITVYKSVEQIAAHSGVKEALLGEIKSWVAVEYLERI